MGILSYLKIGGIAAVLLAVWLAWTHYESLLEDNQTLTSNNEKLTAQIAAQERAAEQLARAAHDLNEQFATARNQSQQQQEVLKRHDLREIAKAKPGLLVRRINAGTKRVFRDLERAGNHRAEAMPEPSGDGQAKPD